MQTQTKAERSWEDITSLVDHIALRCHPATRRSLAAACACADEAVRDALRAFAAKLEQQIAADEALLTTVRALAEARAGRGPFPAPPFTAVHACGQLARHSHARLNETLRQIRTHATSSNAATIRAVDALVLALAQQSHLFTNELLPWARDLEPEPEREHVHHRATKHHAHARANRRANELHPNEAFAVAPDFIHRKRA